MHASNTICAHSTLGKPHRNLILTFEDFDVDAVQEVPSLVSIEPFNLSSLELLVHLSPGADVGSRVRFLHEVFNVCKSATRIQQLLHSHGRVDLNDNKMIFI